MQFTCVADHNTVDQQFGTPARMPGQVLRRTSLDRHTCRSSDGIDCGERICGLHRAPRSPRTVQLPMTRQNHRDVHGLVRQRLDENSDLVVGRSPIHRKRIDRMLARMFGTSGDGIHDRLMDFTRPVTGSIYFAPSLSFLAAQAERYDETDSPAGENLPGVPMGVRPGTSA